MPSAGCLIFSSDNGVALMRPCLDSQALVSHSKGYHQLSDAVLIGVHS